MKNYKNTIICLYFKFVLFLGRERILRDMESKAILVLYLCKVVCHSIMLFALCLVVHIHNLFICLRLVFVHVCLCYFICLVLMLCGHNSNYVLCAHLRTCSRFLCMTLLSTLWCIRFSSFSTICLWLVASIRRVHSFSTICPWLVASIRRVHENTSYIAMS